MNYPGKPRQELKAGTLRQELKWKCQGYVVYWLLSGSCSAFVLILSRPSCLGMVLPTGGTAT